MAKLLSHLGVKRLTFRVKSRLHSDSKHALLRARGVGVQMIADCRPKHFPRLIEHRAVQSSVLKGALFDALAQSFLERRLVPRQEPSQLIDPHL